MNSSTRQLTRIAVGAALIVVLAPISIPMPGEVPVSLATLAVMLFASLTDRREGTMAVLIYLLLGAVGIPVFAGYQAGFQVLFGPTGGYLIGYLPLAYLTGAFAETRKVGKNVAGMILGTLACYGLGTIWFMQVTKTGFLSALTICVLPFLPGDALKISLTTFCANRLWEKMPAIAYEK